MVCWLRLLKTFLGLCSLWPAWSSNICGENRKAVASICAALLWRPEGGAGRSQLEQHLPLTRLTLASSLSTKMYFYKYCQYTFHWKLTFKTLNFSYQE